MCSVGAACAHFVTSSGPDETGKGRSQVYELGLGWNFSMLLSEGRAGATAEKGEGTAEKKIRGRISECLQGIKIGVLTFIQWAA